MAPLLSLDNCTEEMISASEDSVTLPAQDAANRSRWHSLLYEAGGISAAVSEESMRKLKYCLHWLQVCRIQIYSIK